VGHRARADRPVIDRRWRLHHHYFSWHWIFLINTDRLVGIFMR